MKLFLSILKEASYRVAFRMKNSLPEGCTEGVLFKGVPKT